MSEQLSTKAIRLHLLWGYWKPEKTDKAITATTNKSLGVQGNRGHYDKELFSTEYMRPLREHTSRTKRFYYLHTLPWEDRVSRLASVRKVEEIATVLNRNILQYEEILRRTVGDDAAYMQAIYDQRLWLGASWAYGDYPGREAFMQRYHARLDIMPLTTTTDLRCELSESLRAQIAESIERDTAERFRLAMADCWKKLYEPVRKMADTLSQSDASFRNTLVGNIREVCEVMPELNILDDPELKRMTDEVMGRLADADTDALKDDAGVRMEYAQRAGELADMLRKMGVA